MGLVMKVLVVEDEMKVASFIIKGLAQQKIVCDHASDGKEAQLLCQMTGYDAIILDIMLPKMTGWDVVAAIRKTDHSTPILILSACDHVEDRVRGLEAGADDYLVKPFSFSELLARLHSVARRRMAEHSPILTIGDVRIDTNRHAVVVNNNLLNLTDKEYKLLIALTSKPGRIFSRIVLAERVWGIDYDHGSNVVDVTMYRLRQKLEDRCGHKHIRTVRGVGYVFHAD